MKKMITYLLIYEKSKSKMWMQTGLIGKLSQTHDNTKYQTHQLSLKVVLLPAYQKQLKRDERFR